MSNDIAIRVSNLSKCYQIYDTPRDRLKQFVVPKLCRSMPAVRKLFPTSHSPRSTDQGAHLPLTTQHAPVFYKEFWALKGVSFEIKKGEVIGIIGRNGSGKSTLLQMICGTLNSTNGSVQTSGRIAALLELGSGFNPDFTGRENVYMNAVVLGLSNEEIDARFNDIVAFADIGDFIEQPVKTYSSGMVVRLAFAVASCVDPEILVVDEALAVGDSVFQAKCFRRFQQLRDRGTTVLLVTHDIGSVIQLCNHAHVLHGGYLVASGSPKVMGDEYRRRCAEEASGNRDLTIQASSSAHPASLNSNLDIWMERSPNTQEYGDGRATFEGFALLGSDGQLRAQIVSGEEVTLRMKIKFHEACIAPIAAFGFNDLAGNEMCGTNSWYENHDIGHVETGQSVEVAYRFKLPLQAGVYSLRIACTEMGAEGLVAHHRLYDVAVIEVNAERRFTGKFDLQSSVSVIRNA
jgi:lipopolysaccharide transport system ATP-binding protein